MKDLGNRMKDNYEGRYRIKLTRRMPVILRLDGKAFHTFCKNMERPFDTQFCYDMESTAFYLCENIQGAKCAYVQSDEISILLTDYDKLTTEAWFDYNIQKMVSVASGMASAYFTMKCERLAVLDCRAFNIPKEEVCNYFIWRQKDWRRNSVQMMAQSLYSHKELQCKKTSDLHEMIYQSGEDWEKLDPIYKYGSFICNEEGCGWIVNYHTIFSEQRARIEILLEPEE